MGDGKEVLDISTKDLKSAAPTFRTQSGELLKAATTLGAKLDALGQPWGGEEQVKEFAEKYTAQRSSIESAVSVLVQGLASIHAAMADMSDGHVDNEDAIRGMFNRQETPDWLPSQREWHPPMAAPQAQAPGPSEGSGPTG
ncbi:WXG100 family type VII secretion target [Streptomyces armeniacus]|uniref:WXG100 family type VII secretion target n=1 Tax=Streptomyces armeniacus TaxID=83291 RepID=UPI001FE8CCDF|nr:hypothetical protein [Streptomyces armeniacus]